jgi:membrane-associated phospholipid phosphatase
MSVELELELARRHGRAPLIPEYLWRWIGPLLGVLSMIVVAGGVLIAGKTGPLAFERRIMDSIDSADVSRHLMRLGMQFGAPRFFAALVIALALWAAVRQSWPELIACAGVPAAVLIVELVLKPIIDRHYMNDVLCYPSGTATGVAAWTTLTWLLAMPAVRSHGLRLSLAICLAALAALTAFSTVGDHAHYPLDAVAGFASGMGIVLGWAALIDRYTGVHQNRSVNRDAMPSDAA